MANQPPETVDLLSRRQHYVRALCQHGTQQFVPLLQKASADELRWIVRILDLQLSEGGPDQVTDPNSLRQVVGDLRLKRSLALSRLSQLEVLDREPSQGGRLRYGLAALILAGLAAAIGIAWLIFRQPTSGELAALAWGLTTRPFEQEIAGAAGLAGAASSAKPGMIQIRYPLPRSA